jgi:hypothetical protein
VIPVRYNLRSLVERGGTSIMTMLGLGMVAMIFIFLFGYTAGAQGNNPERKRRWQLDHFEPRRARRRTERRFLPGN